MTETSCASTDRAGHEGHGSCAAGAGSRDRADAPEANTADTRTADAVCAEATREAIAGHCTGALNGAARAVDPADDPAVDPAVDPADDPADDPDTLDRAAHGLGSFEDTPGGRAAAANAAGAFEPTPPERSVMQGLREAVAERVGAALGTAQAAGGWAADMAGGVAAVAEAGYEAAVSGVEAATGWIDDGHAARQRADLEARAEGLKQAAAELVGNPEGVARAVAEAYEARFEAADALERAYRSGHADLSALTEAARIRAEARTELGILGVETAAIAAGGAGAVAKGLRAARLADRFADATPVALAMATADRARDTVRAVEDLATAPGRTGQFGAADVAAWVDTDLARRTPGTATGTGVRIEGDWLRGSVRTGTGAPVPDRIAARLAGQEFADFRSFREAFWKEVAADPELAAGFSASNRISMAQGRAPFAPVTEHVGQRRVFELHHVKALYRGGQVYDIDNIQVMTPRAHIEKSRNE